jgi:hypothetical protein
MAPLGHVPLLPGGAHSQQSTSDTLAHLFPAVTPSPAASPPADGSPADGHPGGRDTALTSGVIGGAGPAGSGPGGLFFLALAAAATVAIAASTAWLSLDMMRKRRTP